MCNINQFTLINNLILCTSLTETFTDTVPTIGFSKLVTKHKGMIINIYDLGGSARIREIWQNYFAEVFNTFLKFFENPPSKFYVME